MQGRKFNPSSFLKKDTISAALCLIRFSLMEPYQLLKLKLVYFIQGPKPEETTASGSGGAPADVKASTTASSTPPGSSTEKVSTGKYRNYAVVAGTITALGALGWYLKSGGKKQEEVQG